MIAEISVTEDYLNVMADYLSQDQLMMSWVQRWVVLHHLICVLLLVEMTGDSQGMPIEGVMREMEECHIMNPLNKVEDILEMIGAKNHSKMSTDLNMLMIKQKHLGGIYHSVVIMKG